MNNSEIAKIYKEFCVPKSIIRHMKKVAIICLILADKLTEKGIKIDRSLLMQASLLHDVLRICDIKNPDLKRFGAKIPQKTFATWENLRKKYQKIGHEKAISKILRARGKSKLANLTRKHDFFLIDKLKTWEEKILYYADKRVDHDRIVSLRQRFREGRKRNNEPGDDFALIGKIEKKVLLLEKEIFRKTGGITFRT